MSSVIASSQDIFNKSVKPYFAFFYSNTKPLNHIFIMAGMNKLRI